MRQTRNLLRAVAPVAAFVLVVAACGGGGTPAARAKKGGTLVLAAEQELKCADWIDNCAALSWGTWTFGAQTMPRPFEQVNGKYVASNLLAREPRLVDGPPQVVTYDINPKAVWSDGQPITSHDFKYTWDQIVNGTNIFDTSGYSNIGSVDDSDPHKAVVTFKADEPYAAWRDLFGGFDGVFPSHLLEGKDRDALTKDGYDWSGGPWIAKWNKGSDITLTPNRKYWGDKPKLDKVVFKFITDTAAEASAFRTGQVTAAYPQPEVETAQLFTLPGTKHVVTPQTTSLEGIWLNAEHFPFTSKSVRQAIAYSLDREAIVRQLFGPLDPKLKASQSLNFDLGAGSAGYYEPVFSKYHKDLAMVTRLMTGDGWTKNGSGIWAKGGQTASFNLSSTTGNKRRDLAEQLLQSQLEEAGFEVKTPFTNSESDTLGSRLAAGDFDAAVYAQVATLDPGLCSILCSENIPTAANNNTGSNYTRLVTTDLDKPWGDADKELGVAKRNALVKQGEEASADQVPAVPIDALPNVVIWNGNKVGGPIGDNPTYGAFWNLNEWYLVG